jgi:hypothetical protein
MSYLIYINGSLIDAPSISFAQTKQVNDIANLTNRNSNYTQNIKIPRTAKNQRIFDGVGFTGSQSNLPYTKSVCNIIDADTGQHVIYNGWAVLIETTEKDFNITVYDGVIDFYKAIDNLTLTECGLDDLNHVKTLDSVIDSWNNDLPYKYILADYNGNNVYDLGVSVDFQVPSAKVSYLFERIAEYVGYEFQGTIFNHEYFQNLWLTYPKPILLNAPVQNLVGDLTSTFREFPISYGSFLGSRTIVEFYGVGSVLDWFDPLYYTASDGAKQSGLFRLNFSPCIWKKRNQAGQIIETTSQVRVYSVGYGSTGIIQDVNINVNNGGYVDLYLNSSGVIGDKFYIVVGGGSEFEGIVSPTETTTIFSTPTTGSLLSVNFITGFNVGFDNAFIDFKVSDFIKEIVIRFGLTMFKDKYTNKVKFLTLSELLQGQEINNLTDKFVGKVSEKYTFGSYAKKNNFKYKYNDDEATHNNGNININNENLAEEFSILQSNVYSPEKNTSVFLTNSNVYKIWDKEIKDDETVTYKDLDGRFYFMRAEEVNAPLLVGSNLFGIGQTVPKYYRENYFRLSFNDIIRDWYAPIQSLFNKAKMVTAEFYLKAKDVFNFPFNKLAYIDQLGSYYLVNKINNIVKGKPTKVELIEVDYMTEIEQEVIPPNYIVIATDPVISSCEISFNVTTDYPDANNVVVKVYSGYLAFGEVLFQPFITNPELQTTIVGGVIIVPIDQLPYNEYGYRFEIVLLTGNPFININSPLTEIVAIDGTCYITETYPDTLTINNIQNLGVNPWLTSLTLYTINFSYTGMPLGQVYTIVFEGFSLGTWAGLGSATNTQGSLFEDFNQNVTGYLLTKIRISINGVVSNEVNV